MKNVQPVVPPSSVRTARRAGLKYVSDRGPGIRRVRTGKRFNYVGPTGREVNNPRDLRRIDSLVIPPAWEDVWICPIANGHLQATGRDARGRKQYRYHPQWNAVRNATKFDRMLQFGHLLPRIRRTVHRHLRKKRLSYERVMAGIVRLLENTAIRVGNEEYAVENNSYGLTTIHGRHVDVKGSRIRLNFVGKHGKPHTTELNDKTLARIIRHCQDLPGQELFKYVDEHGRVHDVTSTHVNDYIRTISGEDFTAKDFRTWAGTVQAVAALLEIGPCRSQTHARKNIVECIKRVAAHLNNRPATCRKYYVHPRVLEAYQQGLLSVEVGPARPDTIGRASLSLMEKVVMRVLRVPRSTKEGTNG